MIRQTRLVVVALALTAALTASAAAAPFNLACKWSEIQGDATPRQGSGVLDVNADHQTLTWVYPNGQRGAPFHANFTDTAISWEEPQQDRRDRDSYTISRLTGAYRREWYVHNAVGDPLNVWEGTCTKSAQQF